VANAQQLRTAVVAQCDSDCVLRLSAKPKIHGSLRSQKGVSRRPTSAFVWRATSDALMLHEICKSGQISCQIWELPGWSQGACEPDCHPGAECPFRLLWQPDCSIIRCWAAGSTAWIFGPSAAIRVTEHTQAAQIACRMLQQRQLCSAGCRARD